MPKILDGKVVRDKIMEELGEKISGFSSVPALAIIQIGDNPDSDIYVKRKIDFAKKIGANAFIVSFPNKDVSQEDLEKAINKLNKDETVNGIIIQSPLPAPLDWSKAIEYIYPQKDVDGVCDINVKHLLENKKEGIVPATARGVLSLMKHYDISVNNKNVVVMGRSRLVGTPIANVLRNANAKVTVCHSKTIEPDRLAREADILVVAIGESEFVGADYSKEGQVIIDVGINTVINADGTRKVHGDVDFDSVKDIVSEISPVPGGVGPMTVASLFQNLVEAFEKQQSRI